MIFNKTLFVVPSHDYGGAQGILVDLLRALVQQSSKIEPVVVCAQNSLTAQKCQALSLKTYELPVGSLLNPLMTAQTFIQLVRIVRAERPQAILGNDFGGHFYSALIARYLHVPTVWWIHGIAIPGITRTWFVQWLTSKLPATRVVTNSQWTRNMLAECLKITAEVIDNGIELERFAYNQDDGAAIRQELGIESDALVISSIGRLIPMKGHHIFLRAFAASLADWPTARALVVGGSDWGEEYGLYLQQLAVELGITNQVIFTGYRDDVQKLFMASDIFVHANTIHESFGLTIVEAMAVKRPVIATKTGGPEEIVLHGQTGFLVEPDNVSEMASYMRHLAGDPDLRQRLGEAGAARARQKYALSRMAQEFERVLLEL